MNKFKVYQPVLAISQFTALICFVRVLYVHVKNIELLCQLNKTMFNALSSFLTSNVAGNEAE